MIQCHTDMSIYMKELSKYPLLTKEQEQTASPETLILHNARLVVAMAKKFVRYGVELDDLVSAGNIGLQRATKDFDPKRARFCTYAGWWIKNEIRKLIREKYLIHVPYHLQGEESKANPKCLEAAKKVMDAEVSYEFLEDLVTRESVYPLDISELVPKMLACLTDTQRLILTRRFWDGLTLSQIGVELGVTKERVRQIQVIAIQRLRIKFNEFRD